MSGWGKAYVKVMKENRLCRFCSYMKSMKVLTIFNERYKIVCVE